MSRRTTVLVAIVAVLGVCAAVLIVRARADEQRRAPLPLDIPAAEQLARRACAGLVTFEEQIEANASSVLVLDTLETLRSDANDAADRDPRWRSLASGTDALRLALRENDGDAARTGIDVVRAQCDDTT